MVSGGVHAVRVGEREGGGEDALAGQGRRAGHVTSDGLTVASLAPTYGVRHTYGVRMEVAMRVVTLDSYGPPEVLTFIEGVESAAGAKPKAKIRPGAMPCQPTARGRRHRDTEDFVMAGGITDESDD